jgi:transcriptional regulator GlxA family with amidase domain
MNTVQTEPAALTARHRTASLTDSRQLEIIRKIDESILYMSQHLNMPLRVATLAARTSLSKSHFNVLFKRYVGSTPIDYFIRLRLQQACRLLQDTEMSVKAIAYTLGYDDPFYFSRIFKSFNRIAPSQYRRLQLEAPENGRDRQTNSLVSRLTPGERRSRSTPVPVCQPTSRWR